MSRGFLDEDGDDDEARDVDRSSEVTLACKYVKTSGGAALYNFGDQYVWVPGSVVRRHEVDTKTGVDRLTLPEWFARREGLI